MSKEEGLLEALTHRVGASYISDLRKENFRGELIRCINELDGLAYTAKEWLDVLDYLTGKRMDIQNSVECKQALIDSL